MFDFMRDWWNDVQEAKTWYDKIKVFLLGKDMSVWEFLENLNYAFMGGSIPLAKARVLAKSGPEAAEVVEKFLTKEGMGIETTVAKVIKTLAKPTVKTSLQVVAAISKVVTRIQPFSLPTLIGDITGKMAFDFAKKAVTDLLKTVISPAFVWVNDIRFALSEFVYSVEGAFTSFNLWRGSIVKWIAEVATVKIAGNAAAIVAIQAQIDKYILKEITAIKADIVKLKASIKVQFAESKVYVDVTVKNVTTALTKVITSHIADYVKYKVANELEIKALKTTDAALKKDIVTQGKLQEAQGKLIKNMPEEIQIAADKRFNMQVEEGIKSNTDIDSDIAADLLNDVVAAYWIKVAPILISNVGVINKVFANIGTLK